MYNISVYTKWLHIVGLGGIKGKKKSVRLWRDRSTNEVEEEFGVFGARSQGQELKVRRKREGHETPP